MRNVQLEKIKFIKDIKEGYSYLMERESLKNTFCILISLNFFLGFAVTVPLPYIINTVLNLSSKQFGMIQGTFPIGMIVGAMLVKKDNESFFLFLSIEKNKFYVGNFYDSFRCPSPIQKY